MKKTIVVTGASGYIAGFVIKELLENGFNVFATTSSKRIVELFNAGDLKVSGLAGLSHLFSLKNSENLKLFFANLEEEGAFDQVMQGADAVIHLAAHVDAHGGKTKDFKKEFLDPALKGSLNILHSCQKSKSIKRLVYTSTLFAITTNVLEIPITEKIWNDHSTLETEPYAFSKTQAERSLIQFTESNSVKFDIKVICPTGVMGPHLSSKPTEVTDVVRFMMQGWYPLIPQVPIPVVDVRDVAHACVMALEHKTFSNERFLCGEHCCSAFQVGSILSKKFPNHALPLLPLPTVLFQMMPTFGDEGLNYAKRNAGKLFKMDCSHIKKELGITFRPMENTIWDCGASLIEHKLVPSSTLYRYHIASVVILSSIVLFLSWWFL